MSEKDIFAGFMREATGEAGTKKTPGRKQKEPQAAPEMDDEDAEPYELLPLRPEDYKAFQLGKRRGERLIIYRASQPMRFPVYHELRDISFDQAFQQGGFLFFHAMTVEIMGRNLWPVFHAIGSTRCAAIYEYHAKLYPAPASEGEPQIDSIKLLPPEPLADDEAEAGA